MAYLIGDPARIASGLRGKHRPGTAQRMRRDLWQGCQTLLGPPLIRKASTAREHAIAETVGSRRRPLVVPNVVVLPSFHGHYVTWPVVGRAIRAADQVCLLQDGTQPWSERPSGPDADYVSAAPWPDFGPED